MKKTLLTILAATMATTSLASHPSMMPERKPCPPQKIEWYGRSIDGFPLKYLDIVDCGKTNPHQRYIHYLMTTGQFTEKPCVYGIDKNKDGVFGEGEIFIDVPQCDGWNGNEREPGE